MQEQLTTGGDGVSDWRTHHGVNNSKYFLLSEYLDL